MLSSTGVANPDVVAGSALDDNAASFADKAVDNATPTTSGIYSQQFTLSVGAEPLTGAGTENGAFSDLDAAADSNGEMTIDFGFRNSGTLDYGDWAGGTTPANAGTTTANATINANLRLGATVDSETSVTPTAAGNVDDNTSVDDEDGVIMPGALIANTSTTIPVNVFNNSGAAATLQGWIDFNNDGTFNNTDVTSGGERVYNASVSSSASMQVVNVVFTVPSGASVGTQRGARFRLSSASTTPTGTGVNGEIEDFAVAIVASTGCYEMDLVTGTTVTTCTGCFTDSGGTAASYGNSENYTVTFYTGNADKMRAAFTAFATEASYDYLYVYDGPSTLSPLLGTYHGTTSPGTITGSTSYLTFRFTSDSSTVAAGWTANLSCVASAVDFGDWAHSTNPSGAATTTTSSTVNTNLRLGALVDGEASATTTVGATGDDGIGVDDEDGINPLPVMTPGGWGWLNANVTNNSGAAANLDAWIDFNNDGDFADSGEQIVTNVSIATGTTSTAKLVPFQVPAAAVTGTNLGMRVRFTSTSSPGPTGASGTGEVEDYVVQVTALSTPAAGEWLVTDHGPYWTSTRGSQRIWRLPSGGGSSATTTPPAGMTTWSTATPEPMGITFLNGNYYVTDFAQSDTTTNRPTVVEVAPNGAPTGKSWTLGSSVASVPNAWDIITIGSNLYVALFNSPNGAAGIYRIDPSAFATGNNFVATPWSALRPIGNWRGPNGLAVGTGTQAGNILASVESSGTQNSVYAISLSTGTVPGSAMFTETASAAGPGYGGIRDIDTDSSGNIYVSQANTGTLRKYTSAGVLSDASWMNIGVLYNYNPTGSVWGADGNQYLIAYEGGDVWRHGNVSGGQTQWLNWLGADSSSEMFKPKFLVQVPAALDFGDLADAAAGTGAGNYETLLANNGPRHTIVSGFNIGSTVDSESNGQPTSGATGDGADEDGIASAPVFAQGTSGTLAVSVTNPAGGTGAGTLYGFIDWNNDGDFGDTNEATSVAVADGATLVSLPYTVPAAAATGTNLGFRLRLTTDALTLGQAGALGAASNGEVEDYVVQAVAVSSACKLYTSDYVVDPRVNTGDDVERWDPVTGALLNRYFPETSPGNRMWGQVWDIDAYNGLLYVGNGVAGSVAKIGLDGTFQGYLLNGNPAFAAGPGGAAGTLTSAGILDRDASGRLYVLNNNEDTAGRIIRFNSDGTGGVNFIDLGSGLLGMMVEQSSGDVYILHRGSPGGISRYSSAGVLLDRNNLSTPFNAAHGAGSWLGAFYGFGMTQKSGKIYFVHKNWDWPYLEDGVLELTYQKVGGGATATPTWGTQFKWFASNTFGVDGMVDPRDIEFSPDDGHLYVAQASAVYKFDGTTGTHIATFPSKPNTMHLKGLAFGCPPVLDFGDHIYGTLAASSAAQTASPDIRIGTNATDAEATDPSDAGADKDDTMGTDDEDVTMPSFTVGTATTLTVPVTLNTAALSGATSRVRVFVDWNEDGDVADTNETLAAQTASTNGLNTLSFSLLAPAGTTAGTKYLRLRATEGSTAPTFAGASALKGEVEDYAVTVSTSVDPNCYQVVVVNLSDANLVKFDGASGASLGVMASSLANPSEVCAAPDGNILVSMTSTGAIARYNPYTNAFVANLIASGANAYSLTPGSDGYLYVGNTNISRYNISTGASVGAFATVSSPVGSAFLPDGKFIVLDQTTASIRRYTSAGVFDATVSTVGSSNIHGLTVGPDGNYYSNSVGIPGVNKVTPAGTRTTFTTIAGSDVFSMAWGPDGILWVGDAAGDKLYRINSAGTLLGTITTSINNPCGVVVTACQPSDFGDLPSRYATYIGHNGPRHIVGTLKMGTNLDADGDGLPNLTATGDDTDFDGDDEDGVTIPTLTAGSTATVVVSSSAVGKVNAFFDWNNDNDFADAGEAITELSVVAGNNNLSVPVPAGAVTATSLGARFRLSTAGGLTSVGGAADGEVEDYLVTVNAAGATDFGDYSGFSSASSSVNTNLRMGALVDSEASITGNVAATGDDEGANTDEDGVTVPAILTQGAASSMAVRVTNATGSAAYLNAWIDFNGDGVLTDVGEQVATNTNIATGTNNATQTINFTVPAGATPGTAGVRVRLTSTSGPGATGVSGTGEVEDYVTTIGCASVRMSPALLATAPDQAASTPFTWSNVASSGVNVSLTWEDVDAGFASHGFRGYNMGDPGYGNGGVFIGDDPSYAFTGDSRFTFSFSQPVTEVIIHYAWLSNGYGAEELINWAATGSGTLSITHTEQGAHPDVGGGWSNLANVLTGRSHWNGSKVYCDSGIHDGVGTLRITTTGSMNSLAFTLDAISGSNAGFVIREVAFCPLPAVTSDYGDYNGFASATQAADTAIRIGTLATDAEAASPANGSATGDDSVGDDEDLTMPPLYVDQYTNLTLPITLTPASLSGGTARANVWVDWNGDGDALDTEEALTAQSVSASGPLYFTLHPPAGTTVGTKYLRVRVTEGGTAPSFGGASALKGEVEDYAVTVGTVPNPMPLLEYRFETTSPVMPATPNVKSACISTSSQLQPVANTNGLLDIITEPENGYLRTGSAALSVWGTATAYDTALEATRTSLTPITKTLYTTLTFSPGTAGNINGILADICPASLGPLNVRFFLTWYDGTAYRTAWTNTATLTPSAWTVTDLTFVNGTALPTGGALGGKTFLLEVAAWGSLGRSMAVSYADGITLDNLILAGTCTLPTADFGDFVDLPEASSTVVSNLRLGALSDAEAVAMKNGAALGDDLHNTDDEDGVAFSTFTPGQAATITVTATNNTGSNAYLNAWADWNEDGDLLDANETLTSVSPATQITVSSSATVNRTFTFNFTVPSTARGTIPVRVRLTSVSAPGPDGQDGNGEVEDHLATIATTCASQLAIYNAIISNTLATPSDIQGRAVIKSIVGTNSYSTGHLVSGAATIAAAIQTGAAAGGQINVVNGSLWAPSVASLNGRTVNFPGGGSLLTSPAFDFTTVFNSIAAESATYAAMPTNSTINIPASPAVAYLTVGSGVTNGTPAVFSIDGNTLLQNGNVQTIDLNLNGKTPSAIIINVTGTNITYSASGENNNMLRDTTWRPKILWHFPNATTIDTYKSLYGSILAPNATLYAGGGANEGSIMVKDYTGNIAIKLPYWTGGASVCTDASDYGDSLAFSDASSTAVTNIKLGANPGDVDATPASNAAATADDSSGTDDEDGLTAYTLTIGGGSNSLTISRSNTSGANAYLNAWIDWDGDGILGETHSGVSDQVISAVTIATGTTGSQAYSVTMPTGISAATVHARIRFTSTSAPGATGFSGNGEVEDHTVILSPPLTDFGDHIYGSLAASTASQTASTDIRIGTNATDVEASDPSNGGATVDDTTGTDDEDVTMPTFIVGAATSLSVPVTLNTAGLSGATSRVRVFVDWNGDGDVADTNETLASQTAATNGANSLSFSLLPPAGTTAGTKYLRIRATEGSIAPTFSGASALKGEVEDYAVTVMDGAVDFGDWVHATNTTGAATTTTFSTVDSNLRIGATVDSEASVTPNAVATADGADEDGVWIAPSVPVGSYAQLSVKATNLTGSAAYLNAWVDFDDSGAFDAGEQVAANVTVPTGTTDYDPAGYNSGNSLYQYYRLQFLVPATASIGTNRGVRVRLSSVLNTPATGASGTGEVEDYVMTFTAQTNCNHFRLADANGDVVFNPATEITPAQTNSPIYWDNNGDMGTFKDVDVTFNNSTKLLNFDCTVLQKTTTGVRTDGVWFMINTGPLPLQTPVRRYAMVYLDGFNRASPKATVYVEDSLQHSGSWTSPGYLMVSTAPGGANASDVKVLSVTEDTVAKTVRFRFTMDCTRINDRAQWPAGWSLDPDWRGIQFWGNVGMWCTATDMTAAPTYDASGKATAMNMSATSLIGIDVHPMGFTPIITEPCGFDFGDHFFFNGSSASQAASVDIRIGTNATDAEGDYSDSGASLDDTTGTNDEDLAMPSFTVGSATALTVPVTIPVLANLSGGTSRVGVWVDWNADGDVLDANEAIAAQAAATTPTTSLSFSLTPPAGTTLGTKYLRIRATEGSAAPAFSGASALKGEVEDYAISVASANTQCAIVAAFYDNTIYTYSAAGGLPDGGFVTAGSGLNGPYGMKQGPDGNVYVTSSATSSIKRFNISTGLFMGDFVTSGSGGLNYPQGLAWGPDGNLYVGSYTSVKKYNGTTGAYISDFTTTTIAATPNYFNTHQGITFGPDGNLYVGDFNNNRVLKFHGSTGAFISEFTLLAAGAYPKGMSFGPDGHLYIVQSGLENVLKINGTTGASMGVFTALGGKSPTGLTWNSTDGNLYINALDGNVYKINGTTGAVIGPFAVVQNGGAKDIIFTNQICPPAGNCGVGNTIFVDANGNGLADYNEYPPGNVLVQIFRQGDNPQVASPLETRMTSQGIFKFNGLAPGSYFLHVPASQFQVGAPLHGFTSIAGNGSDNGNDSNDDGIDAASPATTGVSSIVFTLAPDTEPTDTGTETGIYSTEDNNDDNNIDLTIDLGFNTGLSVGNRVWIDTNGDGVFQHASGELPLDGVKMNLYRDADANGTLGAGDGAPIATQHTSNGGYYRFNGLSAGGYIVEVAASNFSAGGILEGFTTTAGASDPNNNTDNDDNGAAVAGFGVASSAIALTAGGEPTTDGDADSSSNLTVDFGFNCAGSLTWTGYVSNHTSDKINQYTWSAGAYTGDLVSSGSGGLSRPYDSTLGPNGDLFVCSAFSGEVKRYNSRTGAFISTFIAAGNNLDTPSGITFGPDGNCYVASRATNVIKRYNGATGAFMGDFITAGLAQPFQGLLWSTDNKLYVGNYASGEIRRYSLNGAFLDSISLPAGVLTVRGFQFGPDGALYVAAHNNLIYRVTTGAVMAISVFATGPTEAYAHVGFGPDGHLYATDLMNNRVRKFNGSTGADLGLYTSAGALGEPKEIIFFPLCSVVATADFGDWPSFPSASQTASADIKIGSAATDAETANPSAGTATADDTTGTDDEDLSMPYVVAGLSAAVNFETFLTGSVATGRIAAWVDWNGDGLVTGANESITLSTANLVAGRNGVIATLSPPAGTTPGVKYLRVRVTEGATVPAFSGVSALKGEVEDYPVTVLADNCAPTVPGPMKTLAYWSFDTVDSSGTNNVDDPGGTPPDSNDVCVTVSNLVTNTGSASRSKTSTATLDDSVHGSLQAVCVGNWNSAGRYLSFNVTVPAGTVGNLGWFTFSHASPVDTVPAGLFTWEPNNYARNWTVSVHEGATQLATVSGTAFNPQWGATVPLTWATNTADLSAVTFNGASARTVQVRVAFNNLAGNGATRAIVEVDEFRLIGCCGAAVINSDFGDWSGAGALTTTTSSSINNNISLGATVESEASATANAAATGDDNTGSDDEDGVLLPSMIAGATPSLYAGTNPVISIRTHNLTGANAFLNAWMDFNGNGAFDASEQIITNYSVSSGRDATIANNDTASFSFQFNLPSTAAVGVSGLRFRFTTTSGAPATGAFGTGEVEDYVVNVLAPCTNMLNNGNFESGVAAQPNPKKNGDANTTLTPIPGWTFVQLSGSGGGYTADGFDNRPAMADGMHEAWIIGDGAAVVGGTSTAHMYQDVAASPGATYDLRYAAAMHDPLANIGEVRVQYLDSSDAAIAGYPMLSKRITHDTESTWPFTSFAPDILSLPAAPPAAAKVRVSIYSSRAAGTTWDASKVSDMCLTSVVPPYDFGDWSGSGALTTTTSSIVTNSLRLGPTVDAEASVVPNVTATADYGDEDGVIVPPLITADSMSQITVTASNATGADAFINAWIDFNNDGDFGDAGEQIASNVQVTAGTANQAYYLPYFVPPGAATGTGRGVRVRLTSTSSPGPTGPSGLGEVEDYIVAIAAPATCYHWGLRDADHEGNVIETWTPAQVVTPTYNGYTIDAIDSMDFYYNTATQVFVQDATFAQVAGKRLDGYYFVVSNGPEPAADTQNAIVYVDVFDRNNPKATLYVYDPAAKDFTSGDTATSYASGTMLASSQTAGSPVKITASESGSLLRVRLSIDTSGINNAANYPAYGLGALWQGLYFDNTAGIWSHYYDLVGAPVYDASFQLINWNYDPANFWGIASWFDTHSGTPVFTEPCPVDHGDWNGTGAASATTASLIDPALRLGATVDAEAAMAPNAAATADDITGSDDEDGVTMPASLTLSSSATLPVSVYNNTGSIRHLHAWVDFNNDGSFSDALVSAGGERLEAARAINSSPGSQTANITFTVPASASVGLQRGVRVRVSDSAATTPTSAGDRGEIEDYVVEIASQLALGNLVFLDANGNGRHDTGEGLAGVTVQLYSSTQTPGVDTPLKTQATASGGKYLFSGLLPGFYRVHVPAAMFASGAPLASTISISEGLAGDDDVGEDGINSLTPHITGISSGVVSITLGGAPTDLNGETGVDNTSDNLLDAAIDLTVDFGFANPLGVGNLVFRDQNNNGRADTGEGVAGVTVELYRANDTPGMAPPVATTETDASGHYLFDYLMAGYYYVFVPASEFAMGGQLEGLVSVSGAGGGTGTTALDDNVDENGLDVLSPQATGVRSAPFHLGNNTEPTDGTGETGYLATEDARDDNNYDLTIDLGFAAPDTSKVGLGNLVFVDANGNHVFDAGEGVAGVALKLFAEGVNPVTGSPVATAVSTVGGFYSFAGLAPGGYFVHIAASEFGTGRPLNGKLSIPGAGGDFGQDDNLDENGLDAANPVSSGISSGVVQLSIGDEPTDFDTEVGEGFYLDALDANSDLTVDLGFYSPAGVGNLVFRDLNTNGHADTGEGVAGARVEIYPDGNLPGFDLPLAQATTDAQGRYRFEGLPPGGYFIHAPSSEFTTGKPLFGAVSVTGTQAGDDNAGEDGIDESLPAVFGVSTGVVMLSSSSAPSGTAEAGLFGTDDDARDTAVDLTVDLGFTQPPPKVISGKVRFDLDGDGDVAETGDLPLGGVEVALYLDVNGDYAPDEGDQLLGTVITGADGVFEFSDLTDGSYVLVEADPPGATSTADSFEENDNVIALVVDGADAGGNDFLDVIEPQGYVYDSATGALVTGGTISVTGPGEVRVLLDGSLGVYAWVPDAEAAGLFTLAYTPPSGREMDATRPPQLVALDPTGEEPPLAVGSGLNVLGTHLLDHSAAANPWYASFDLAPGDPVVTRNNLPVVQMSAGTWAGWQYQNPLGGQNGPAQNPDGDAQENLQEFAFALNPASGLASGKRPLVVTRNATTGAIEARVRRATGLSGVTLTLEAIADLASSPSGWFPVTSLTPTITANPDGSETLLYSDLATVPGLGAGRGFVRVKVTLASPAATTRTGACGWSTRVFERSLQTFGAPFISAAEFSGTVAAISGPGTPPAVSFGSASVGAGGSIAAAMTPGKQYFLEIVSGAHAGHRLDVSEASSTATSAALDVSSALNTLVAAELPSTLVGARVELREHATLGDAFDRTRFNSTTSPSTADRVLFFNRATNTYTTYWLFRNSGAPKWVRNGDATLADAGTRVLAPGEGVLAHAKFAVLTTVYTGEARSWAFASPLGIGTQMMANPWPVSQSPSQRVMNTSTGFKGASLASSADQIRLWLGDVVAGQQGYTTYYYFKNASYDQWTRQGDATLVNQGASNLFNHQGAAFLRSVLGNPNWIIPCPWTP